MNIIKTGARPPAPKPVAPPKVAPSKRPATATPEQPASPSQPSAPADPPWETPTLGKLTVHDNLEQGTEQWHAARRGILTASNVKKLVTTKTLKPANNETARSHARKLAAERITGYTEPDYVSKDMEEGNFVEPYVRDFYATTRNTPVAEVGFMVRNIGGHQLGYSPDGLVGDDGLIEIKSRKGHIQLKAFLEDLVPTENMAQIQTGLLVSGRQWCDYVSYSGDMPLHVKRVYPDPSWQAAILETLQQLEGTITHIVTVYRELTTDLPVAERVYFEGVDLIL